MVFEKQIWRISMKAAISTHVWTTGPSQELKKYFIKNKIDKLLWISHPLTYHERLDSSGHETYSKGKQTKRHYKKIKKIPSLLSYLKDVYLNIFYVLKSKEKYNIYVGFDNLNAFAGWILKKLGRTKKSVYYVVDYVPIRFENKILNSIYHKVESFCAVHCDETWNLSKRMVKARDEFKGLNPNKCGLQKELQMGVWFDEIKRYSFNKINHNQLVFMGHIMEKQGVQYVLDAVPSIIKKIHQFKFLIIGDGEYISTLKEKVKELEIEKYITFTGYIKDDKKIEELISRSALAVALYDTKERKRNWTYYTDPGKIKAYLGAGTPVLTTNVPHNSHDIADKKCGMIVDLNPESISKAVIAMLNDKKLLRKYRENAAAYAKNFDWNVLFGGVLADPT
ncbi:glycosyltransferase [Candidatus Woesearchaeota archaeon]|nr:glycosyltransferase [Candidatus Woesearchaeota archaeon]